MHWGRSQSEEAVILERDWLWITAEDLRKDLIVEERPWSPKILSFEYGRPCAVVFTAQRHTARG